MTRNNLPGSTYAAFNAVHGLCVKSLGECNSFEFAGKMAVEETAKDPEDLRGSKLAFTFNHFVPAIKGIIVVGNHGYIGFTQCGEVFMSDSYDSSDLWQRAGVAKEIMFKALLCGLPMMGWVDVMDMDFIDPIRATSHLKTLVKYTQDALSVAA